MPLPRGDGTPGPQPLSAAARKRLLAQLQIKADGGDVGACEALIRLSFERQAEKARHRHCRAAKEWGVV